MATSQYHSTTQESLAEMKGLIEGTKEDLNDQVEKVEETIRGAAESLQDRLRADSAQLRGALQTLAEAQQVASSTRPQIVVEQNRQMRAGNSFHVLEPSTSIGTGARFPLEFAPGS